MGQAMVAIFAMVLITVQIPAIDLIGPWILLNLTYANFALTLLIVASGLLFRHVTPIALIAGGCHRLCCISLDRERLRTAGHLRRNADHSAVSHVLH